jgi:hypothetical protein
MVITVAFLVLIWMSFALVARTLHARATAGGARVKTRPVRSRVDLSGGQPTGIDPTSAALRWSALDDMQLTRLLAESAPGT